MRRELQSRKCVGLTCYWWAAYIPKAVQPIGPAGIIGEGCQPPGWWMPKASEKMVVGAEKLWMFSWNYCEVIYYLIFYFSLFYFIEV